MQTSLDENIENFREGKIKGSKKKSVTHICISLYKERAKRKKTEQRWSFLATLELMEDWTLS